MRAIKHILTIVLMASILCAAALTQAPVFGQKNDNRPPKEQPKIKEKDKPPPSNTNSGNSNRGKKP